MIKGPRNFQQETPRNEYTRKNDKEPSEPTTQNRSSPECTKIAHRRSLAIFSADEGIAGNPAARVIFTRFHRRKNSRFASDFLRRGNRACWGLKKSRDFFGSGKNRRRNRRESRDFGALSSSCPCTNHDRKRNRATLEFPTLLSSALSSVTMPAAAHCDTRI